MDFTTITNINTQIRQTKLKRSFEMQKKQGFQKVSENYRQTEAYQKLSNKEKKILDDKTMLQEMQDQEKDRDEVLAKITDKVAAGQKLSVEEMDYLQEKNPQLYQMVRNGENEQKAYEKRLEGAKTKEEAQKVRTDRAAQHLAEVNTVKNNPNIPEGQKLALYAEINRRVKVEANTFAKFVKSGAYQELPTEAEKHEVEKALREEEREKLGIEQPEGNAENDSEAQADLSGTEEREAQVDLSGSEERESKVDLFRTDEPKSYHKEDAAKTESKKPDTVIDAETKRKVNRKKKYQFSEEPTERMVQLNLKV